MTKRLLLGLGLLLSATYLLVAVSITNPTDLTRPVSISGANAMGDGGSMEVQVQGANGKKLSIRRQGSLGVERSQQPMYLVNYVLGVVPFRRQVERNSQIAKDSQNLLESWLHERLKPEQRSKLVVSDPSTLREIPMDVVLVFDLAHWIGE